jgi:hypothetical protein
MDQSKLLERWKAYQDRYPDPAKRLKQALCELYEARNDQQKFNKGLDALQELLPEQSHQILGVNVIDRQSLVAWASAMGFILLIKKENELTGRHAHT